MNFKLKSQTSVVINWADFSVPNILSRQSNEDMKYEYKRHAISCDLVQVWASPKEEGLLQNMSEAVQEILRPAIDTNPHYPSGPLLCAGIDTDYPQHCHTLWLRCSLRGALAKISRWPLLEDHLAILTPTPLWLFFPSTFLLFFYFDNHPAHFFDLLL